MKHVGIIGSFGSGNIGDEAAHLAVKDFLCSKDNRFKFLTHVFQWGNPNLLCNYHTHPFYMLTLEDIKWINENFYAFIITGGGIIGATFGLTKLLNFASMLNLITVPIYSISISAEKGEYTETDMLNIKTLKENSKIFTVRDHHSQRVCKKLGLGDVKITPDIVTLLKSAHPFSIKSSIEEDVMMVMPSSYMPMSIVEFWVKLKGVIKKPITPVSFIPTSNDINLVQSLKGKLPFKTYSAREMLSLMAKKKFIIAGRLHTAVYAAMLGVPFFAINYHPKVKSFCDIIGYQHYYPKHDNTELNKTKYSFDLSKIDFEECKQALLKAYEEQEIPSIKETAYNIMNEVFEDFYPKNTKK